MAATACPQRTVRRRPDREDRQSKKETRQIENNNAESKSNTVP